MTRYTAKSTSEEVTKDLSSQIQGSKILITGVTPGSIGGEAALQISRHSPELLILAGRTIKNLQAAKDAIKAENPNAKTMLLALDLSSQESIRKAAGEVNALPDQIDILVNNAGTMATPYGVTKEQLELQFGTNHIGHFLFTNLILSKKGLSREVKVINVSSLGHRRGPVRFDDYNFQDGKSYDKWQAYGQSKTANILFSVSLAAKLGEKGVKSFSLYPGRIITGISRNLKQEEMVKAGYLNADGSTNYDLDSKWKSLTQAAATLIVAAYDPSIESSNGSYLVNNQVSNDEAADYALDPNNAERLWALSEELVGQKFSY